MITGQKFYSSFSYIYLFVSSFAHVSICAYRVRVFKKEKHHMQVQWKHEWVPDNTALRFISYCKDPDQTVRMHMCMLVWNLVGHMFS